MRFEDELLPEYAQLLDLAATLCPIPFETKKWFARFSNSSGVDDASTVASHCIILKENIRLHQKSILSELDDSKSSRVYHAWSYCLETMIQQTEGKKTCSWVVEGMQPDDSQELGGGNITLRRI